MTLSVIIPVKNEEEIILNTLNHLENSWLADIEHEILIINDNSTDETVNLIKASSKIFLTMAMAAIGLSTNLKDIRSMGYRPFIVGFVSMLTVGIVSILTIEMYIKFFI